VKARGGSLLPDISAHTLTNGKAKIQPSANVNLADKCLIGRIEKIFRLQNLKPMCPPWPLNFQIKQFLNYNLK
jgi:hypothetical protein